MFAALFHIQNEYRAPKPIITEQLRTQKQPWKNKLQKRFEKIWWGEKKQFPLIPFNLPAPLPCRLPPTCEPFGDGFEIVVSCGFSVPTIGTTASLVTKNGVVWVLPYAEKLHALSHELVLAPSPPSQLARAPLRSAIEVPLHRRL